MKRIVMLVSAFVMIQCLDSIHGSVDALEPEALEVGAHIRVQMFEPGPAWIEGRLLKIDQNTLYMRASESIDTLSVFLEEVSTIEGRRGHGLATRMGVSAGVGLLVGTMAGTALGAIAGGDAYVSDETVVGIAAAFVGGVGLVIGALVGIAYEHAHWETIPQSRLSVALQPAHDGCTVGIVFRGRPHATPVP